MSEYRDELMGFAEWTKNQHVLVFRRTYADREFIRVRVFDRHQKHGFWYPSPRSFHVGLDCARELGLTIAGAAIGELPVVPDWWAEFEEQYEPGKWKRGRAWAQRLATTHAPATQLEGGAASE